MMPKEVERLNQLRDQLYHSLKQEIDGIEVNGHPEKRLPHNLNLYIPNVNARALLLQINDAVALSTGSACSTAKVEPSHVITALFNQKNRAYQSIRIGLGRSNTLSEVETFKSLLCTSVKKLRNFVID